MQALNECIVEDEHDSSHIPSWSPIPEQHLSNVANISHFWVTKTELPAAQLDMPIEGSVGDKPGDQRRIENEACSDDGADQTWHEAEDRV